MTATATRIVPSNYQSHDGDSAGAVATAGDGDDVADGGGVASAGPAACCSGTAVAAGTSVGGAGRETDRAGLGGSAVPVATSARDSDRLSSGRVAVTLGRAPAERLGAAVRPGAPVPPQATSNAVATARRAACPNLLVVTRRRLDQW